MVLIVALFACGASATTARRGGGGEEGSKQSDRYDGGESGSQAGSKEAGGADTSSTQSGGMPSAGTPGASHGGNGGTVRGAGGTAGQVGAGSGGSSTGGTGADITAIVNTAFAALGGRDKRLTLFRIEELHHAGVEPGDRANWSKRVSVMEPPLYWWLNGKDRTDEPAKFDVWAWTLGILDAPATRLRVIATVQEPTGRAIGLEVSGSIDPSMQLYFDMDDHRLVRFDWGSDIYRFSEWTTAGDGLSYPRATVMHRKSNGQPWFHHVITKLERLATLPPGLVR
jgi:hypothetical protein